MWSLVLSERVRWWRAVVQRVGRGLLLLLGRCRRLLVVLLRHGNRFARRRGTAAWVVVVLRRHSGGPVLLHGFRCGGVGVRRKEKQLVGGGECMLVSSVSREEGNLRHVLQECR